jgi:multicomponent K+:H+ antiporter subunit E
MKALFPQPAMSVSLFFMWLLLNNSIAPGTIVLGMVFATGLPLITARYWPEHPTTVRIRPLVRLIGIVLGDIVIANLRLAVLILGPARRWRPRFVVIPLDARHPFSITLLASIITLTPGTVSANLSGDRRSLLIHGLAVDDPDATVRRVKQRYEQPLMEILE